MWKRLGPPLVFSVAVLAALAPARVEAQETTPASVEASGRKAFDDGVKAYDAQPPHYTEALEHFRRAYDVLEKPVIKKNIALCLRGLGRHREAILELQAYLASAGGQLPPEQRDAANRVISEMMPLIGTARVNVTVKGKLATGADPAWTLTVDNVEVPEEMRRLPIYLDPGPRAVSVHADGYEEAQKTITVVAGAHDVPVDLELVPLVVRARGTLRLRASVPNAEVSIDDVPVGRASGEFDLTAGKHRIRVVAPGYVPYVVYAVIPANKRLELPVMLSPQPGVLPPFLAPPPQVDRPAAPRPPPPRPVDRVWYAMVGVGSETESLRFGPADSAAGGARETLSGPTVVLHVGRMLGKYFSLEARGEVGGFSVAENTAAQSLFVQEPFTLVNWSLAPELRFHTPGNVRFVAGAALGLEGYSGNIHWIETPTPSTVSGAGVMGLLEGGAEVQIRRVLLQLSVYGDIHSVAGVTDASSARLFQDDAAVRAGARFLVGYMF